MGPTIFNEFNIKQGSIVWPSTNPSDSPCDTFECKHCGEKFSIEMNGAYSIGRPNFIDLAEEKLLLHLFEHCSVDFLKTIQCKSKDLIAYIVIKEISKTHDKKIIYRKKKR